MAKYDRSCSLLKKISYIVTIFVYSFVFISCSGAVARPRVCNFDELNKKGNLSFEDIESCNVGLLRSCKVAKFYQLGDSISDAGNLIREGPAGAAAPFARLPYGANFPTGPTGRASNGNLMIDYLALDAGLPLIPPYKKRDADFSHGVNFAVAGSTALPADVLAALNISSPLTNTSLKVQMDWLSNHISSIPYAPTGYEVLILGPFGGSDYEYALSQGKSIQEIETTLIPKVVDAIMGAVSRLPYLAVKTVLVPGLYTISGLPIHRTASPKENDDLAIRHNAQLQQAIDKLNREQDSYTLIAYMDYFSAYQTMERYAASGGHGMDEKVCCGVGGGEYNFNSTRRCGDEGVIACPDPEKHISWDGINLSQEAYRIMTKYIVYHISQLLGCSS